MAIHGGGVQTAEPLRPRERQALAELGTTRVTPAVCATIIGVFLSLIVGIAVFENVADVRANLRLRDELLSKGVPADQLPGRRPRALNVVDLLPSPRAIVSARSGDDWLALLPSPRSLRAFEDDLLLNSRAGKVLRPWLQWGLTAWLGTGSQRVLLGHDGWLFYSEGVEYVAGPGFLEPRQLTRRQDAGIAADPRPALFQLHDELNALGVTLVVVPVPDKAVVRPESLATSVVATEPVHNVSWNAFADDLRRHGVTLVDASREMFDAERRGIPQFLPRDSHWSPEGVDLVSRLVADALTSRVGVSAGRPGTYVRRRASLEHRNDLVELLDLPASRASRMQLDEELAFDGVRTAAGDVWQPDAGSDVLVIGDSLTEMYSSYEPGLRPAGGFAEQVSYYLQRGVDRRAGRQFGPLDVRRALGETLDEVRKNASGRRVIVWEFAMRKLAVGEWPLLQ